MHFLLKDESSWQNRLNVGLTNKPTLFSAIPLDKSLIKYTPVLFCQLEGPRMQKHGSNVKTTCGALVAVVYNPPKRRPKFGKEQIAFLEI